MANIPTNDSGQLLIAGQSIVGNFYGLLVCASSGSANTTMANFTVLKDGSGGSLLSGSLLSLSPGTSLPLRIISASLDAFSVPVILFR